ncbi:MAG: hypothetical protein CR982_02985 [Candidatus Cloacimonadota bacterium]|nr:MAG: hypothetical protein CR982_02985 [Candidatus Cloacimonadota bacterium]PIE82030.1 MAG: hypothetical protein CSA15_00175 [Candidatus Delongbacteria bacterium]
MKRIFILILPLFLSCVLSNENKKTVLIIGDSTVSSYFISEKFSGWGETIDRRFLPNVRVVNIAKSGATASSFISNGLLEKGLRRGSEFTLIQFGHNEYFQGIDIETYRKSLKYIAKQLQNCGSTPIFVTPVVRLYFNSENIIEDQLLPFSNEIKSLGKELGINVVDLYNGSKLYFESIGEDKALKLSPDRTHFNKEGSCILSNIVADTLSSINFEISNYIKKKR